MLKKQLDLNNLNSNKSSIRIDEISVKDIAVVGISVNFPNAHNAEQYWNNIANKVDGISPLPELRKQDIYDYINSTNTVKGPLEFIEAAYLDEIDKFDYRYFGLTPKEASLMDPNQKLFLETAWKAIEDAGYGGESLRGSRTGVYVGYGGESQYMNLVTHMEPSLLAAATPGNISSIIASRISYLMDFRGPSILVDTSCSSSLVAIYYAMQGLRNGECELAIAGGVRIMLLPLNNAQTLGIESSDGKTRTFDENSDGTGVGEGVAAVILKPLSLAMADKDNIYAVIKGGAINQDGSSVGITAPNPKAQEDVILRAWKDAQINPETIGYIEAHGTGTKLGDPIEIEGIKSAFKKYTNKMQFCAIGSIKSNMGHLGNAAGVAGFIKAVLALKYNKLPPNIQFNKPRRSLGLEESPVYVNDKLREWSTTSEKKRCGISGFGLSGTNCHLILEEAPNKDVVYEHEQNQTNLLTLSAKSKGVLEKLVVNYNSFVEGYTNINLSNLCYTSNTGRGHYKYRLAIVFKNKEEFHEIMNYLIHNGLKENTLKNIYYGETAINNCLDNSSFKHGEVEDRFSEYFKANNKDDKEEILKYLSRKYVDGMDMDWKKIYARQSVNKISIPTYPFERKRCWVEIKKSERNIKDRPLLTVYQSQTSSLASNNQMINLKKINNSFTGDLEKIMAEQLEVMSEQLTYIKNTIR